MIHPFVLILVKSEGGYLVHNMCIKKDLREEARGKPKEQLSLNNHYSPEDLAAAETTCAHSLRVICPEASI